MTRCAEFYDRWQKEENWCNKCPSAVSQINSYLELANLLESQGVKRNFTFVKLPEAVARPLFKLTGTEKEETLKRLAEYLKDETLPKISEGRLAALIEEKPIPAPVTLTADAQIKINEKKIAGYKAKIAALEEENRRLQEQTKVTTITKSSGKPDTVGHAAARKKLQTGGVRKVHVKHEVVEIPVRTIHIEVQPVIIPDFKRTTRHNDKIRQPAASQATNAGETIDAEFTYHPDP